MKPHLILVAFVCASVTLGLENPTVQTRLGALEGSYLTTRRNKTFAAFRGIPYAKPPIGELRFKPPVPVDSWDGVLNATEDGPVCSQPGGSDFSPKSEDCLFLNVYTHEVNASQLKPVFVWFHAGGFYQNTGQSIWHGPDYLMDKDIILVTLNYRLATLGYLSTGDNVSVGNYGMKDQVTALRWVRDNINYFGGDPKNVTIGGYSAGGASVIMHMISPMSRGLFHRAISMSGSPVSPWGINKNPYELAQKQAKLMGCPTSSSQEIVSCISEMPAQDTARIYSGLWEWGYDPMVVLSPVVEKDSGDGSERFLIKDPLQSLLEGDFADVPLIIGTTRDEFAHRALFIVGNETWASDMSENWNLVAPIPFMYEPNENISSAIRTFYLGDVKTPITNDSLPGLGKIYADSLIIFGSLRAAKLISRINKSPVYLYQFTYPGEYSHATWPGTNTPYGVVHHDDLIYLFYISKVFPRFGTDGDDALQSDKSTAMWSNFIANGNPISSKDSDLLDNVTWKPFTEDEPGYLEIGEKLEMKAGLYYQDRFSFWNNLFPLSQ